MVSKEVYPGYDEFFADVAATWRKAIRAFYDAGCRYLQLDDTAWAMMCDPEGARGFESARRRSRHAAGDLCARHQRGAARQAGRHGDHHAFLPRQFPLHFHRLGRLRIRRRAAAWPHRFRRLFPGIRQRPRRRLRAAALLPQGQQATGARPGHLEVGAARAARRDQAPHRGGDANTSRSISCACRRNAASPPPRKATCWPRTSSGRSCKMIVELADEVWGYVMSVPESRSAAVPRRPCRQPAAPRAALKAARERALCQRRDRRRRAQGGRGPRDRARHQEAGRGRPAIHHRRRIPPLVVAARFLVGPRRHRKARHGAGRRLCRRDDA